MAMTCTICRHPERDAINAALIAQEPLRSIAKRTGTHAAAIFRHKQSHLPLVLTNAAREVEVVQAMSLLEQVEVFQATALAIMAEAKAMGNHHIALMAMREGRANMELLERHLTRERYEKSTAGQIERESRRATEQTQWLREHPLQKVMLGDLKKRNEIREATRQIIKLFSERDEDGVENPLELRGASPPQLTATPAADRDNDSLTLGERIDRMVERMEKFRTRVPVGAPLVGE